MLVKELIVLLQNTPSHYSVVLNVPISDETPLLVDLYAEDFAMDNDRSTLEIDGTISEEADEQIQELLENDLHLKKGEVLVLTRGQDIPIQKKSTKSRMKELGITVLTNEILKGL